MQVLASPRSQETLLPRVIAASSGGLQVLQRLPALVTQECAERTVVWSVYRSLPTCGVMVTRPFSLHCSGLIAHSVVLRFLLSSLLALHTYLRNGGEQVGNVGRDPGLHPRGFDSPRCCCSPAVDL